MKRDFIPSSAVHSCELWHLLGENMNHRWYCEPMDGVVLHSLPSLAIWASFFYAEGKEVIKEEILNKCLFRNRTHNLLVSFPRIALNWRLQSFKAGGTSHTWCCRLWGGVTHIQSARTNCFEVNITILLHFANAPRNSSQGHREVCYHLLRLYQPTARRMKEEGGQSLLHTT